jgi:hypothetical protein
MRVCAACILAPIRPAPRAEVATAWAMDVDAERDDCA